MRLLTLALTICTLAVLPGCDRIFTDDVISVTPPELHVFVQDGGNNRIQGATVSVFRSESDREANTNPVVARETDAEGRIAVTAAELANPGVYYIRAASGALVGQGQTPYLLLNDGITYFTVTVQ